MIWVIVNKTTGKPLEHPTAGVRAYSTERGAKAALNGMLRSHSRGSAVNAIIVAAVYGFSPGSPDD